MYVVYVDSFPPARLAPPPPPPHPTFYVPPPKPHLPPPPRRLPRRPTCALDRAMQRVFAASLVLFRCSQRSTYYNTMPCWLCSLLLQLLDKRRFLSW